MNRLNQAGLKGRKLGRRNGFVVKHIDLVMKDAGLLQRDCHPHAQLAAVAIDLVCCNTRATRHNTRLPLRNTRCKGLSRTEETNCNLRGILKAGQRGSTHCEYSMRSFLDQLRNYGVRQQKVRLLLSRDVVSSV